MTAIQQKDGKLELHVPAEFGPDRPAVLFTHESHNTSVKDHPLNQTVPESTHGDFPSILDTPETLDSVLRGPSAPMHMDDMIYTDRPNLTLHVINFTDDTFVTLTYSHSLMDGVGKREVVTNWSKVLAGHIDDVKPVAPFEDDPMATVANQRGEPFIHDGMMLKGWRKWYWVFHLVVWMVRNPVRRQRNLFIPAAAFARIRKQAEAVEEEQDHSVAKAPPPYLSDNVILTAWLARLACLCMPQGSKRPISISSAVDLRGCLQPPDIDPTRAYIQNLVAYTWTHLDVAKLVREPLGRAAAAIRTSLKTQLTVSQTKAAARVTYQAVKNDGSVNMFTDRNSFTVSVSSVAKAKYLEAVNFSPAIIKAGDRSKEPSAETETPPGMPVWQFSTPQCRIMPPCLIVVQGKDRKGNYWVQLVVSTAVWDKIEQEIKMV